MDGLANANPYFRLFGVFKFSAKMVAEGYHKSHFARLANGERNVPGWENFDLRRSLENCFNGH